MFKNIVQTVFYLVVSPRRGWRRVVGKQGGQQEFTNDFLFPIFGFIALATFVGEMWLTHRGSIQGSLTQAIVIFSALFGGFYLASYLLNELFPKFGMAKDLGTAQQFVGYSSVVLYLLLFITPLIPKVYLVWFFVLYTVFVADAGAKILFETKMNESQRILFSLSAFFLVVVSPCLIKFLMKLVLNL